MRLVLIATMVAGVLSLLSFALERLALTDIFHGEPDLKFEWAVVNAALIPIVLFHVLGLVSVVLAMRRLGNAAGR